MAVLFNDTQYYRLYVNFQLSECSNDSPIDQDGIGGSEWTRIGAGISSWVREKVLFPETTLHSDSQSSRCSSISSFDSQLDIYTGFLFSLACVVLVTMGIPLLLLKVMDFCERKTLKTEMGETASESSLVEEPDSHPTVDTALQTKHPGTRAGVIPLHHIKYHARLNNYVSSCELHSFLKRTVDCLFQELDKLLIAKNKNPNDEPLHSTVTSSVRLPRRAMPRAPGRQRSSPSLNSQDPADDSSEILALREFQQKIIYNNVCTHTLLSESLAQSLHGSNRKLLEFCNEVCVVNFEQLLVSNFIVNYTMLLLDKVLKTMSSYHGLRYVSSSLAGSMRKGMKVGFANQSDYSMVFQCTDVELSAAVDHRGHRDIPPGKLVLIALDREAHNVPSKLLKTYEEQTCISPQEFLNAASELIEIAIQKLYKEGRPMVDRLPYRIQRASSPGLQLSLDTRNVVGFHSSDIRVQLIPSLLLSTNKWIDPINLYAVPTWSPVDVKRKVAARDRYATQPPQVTSHDLYWSLSSGDLENFFFNKFDQKCQYSGVLGCHKAVIQILKFLLAPQSRKALLSRGEVPSYLIETAVSYMLVDSKPEQWTMDRLSDRMSDAIHFLRRAIQNGRLPNFYINNPHLAEESEFLRQIKLLFPGRQENLLSDMSPDTVSKTLQFIDSRLTDYNLRDCIKPQYSEDMWEYEYFVYL